LTEAKPLADNHLDTIDQAILAVHARLESAGLYFGHGCDDPYDEAVWLVAAAIGIPVDRIDAESDAKLDEAEQAQIESLLHARISQRAPLAYLTGEAWLGGRRFLCDRRALVPRSPIGLILNEGLEPWLRHPDRVTRVLDLCTGGGSLAIIAAQIFSEAQVTATDLSGQALALAADNLALFGLEDRIELRQGHLWAPVDGLQFDLILCNPPYVDTESRANLPTEWRHEPTLGLDGGLSLRAVTSPDKRDEIVENHDGLDLVRQVIELASAHLTTNGLLILEIGHQGEAFEAAFPNLTPIWLPVPAGEQMIALLERSALPA
jgi:ribosomal protein L3 glutamine methyltransferase